jgi:DNA/RNA endonuclease G (NUC1)
MNRGSRSRPHPGEAIPGLPTKSSETAGPSSPDILISYARSDQEKAAKLRELLSSEGWEVWWDQDLYAGAEWEPLLLDVVKATKIVVVLWSNTAVSSQWVKREADIALEQGKLVPCSIDEILPPSPFDRIETARLIGWAGGVDHPELPALFAGLERLAEPSRADRVRPGFDTSFLDSDVGLPIIPGVGDEFPYLHFSVVMNPARRLAWYVAYNVKAQTYVPDRPAGWAPDPILSRVFQPSNEHFLRTGFDRGHLAAPSAVAWGEDRQATVAMKQAFFWTNTAPQASDVNRWSWLALEQWERQRAREIDVLVGFSGPVLREDDPFHVVTDEVRGRLQARQTFRLPRHYWKVAVWPEGASLRVASFLVPNVEGRDPSAAPRQCSLEEIQTATGLDFGEALGNWMPAGDQSLSIDAPSDAPKPESSAGRATGREP